MHQATLTDPRARSTQATTTDTGTAPRLLTDVTTLPRTLLAGVEIHGRSLRISFTFQGQRCREVVERSTDAAAQARAGHLRAQVLQAIQAGTFCYRSFFPDSPRAAHFDLLEVNPAGQPSPSNLHQDMSVRADVAKWLDSKCLETATDSSPTYELCSETQQLQEKPTMRDFLIEAYKILGRTGFIEAVRKAGESFSTDNLRGRKRDLGERLNVSSFYAGLIAKHFPSIRRYYHRGCNAYQRIFPTHTSEAIEAELRAAMGLKVSAAEFPNYLRARLVSKLDI
ncbi:Arm DNA-binding domain-containing protein [Pseudomonas sp. D(2018)]|uniref:Arm DNA-binding domain-containing protein n=1 Tax=Pseudomonas sp. D(2018) TaxID=2502238 RepID=UPI001485262E|nr:DUF3596 domain-containing protein [Pseudomonas sp. D(2018)]